MKKFTLLSVMCALGIGFVSNTDSSSSLNFVFSAVEEVPVLPEHSFDYSVDFPDHIVNSIPDDPVGYETVSPNTDLADNVTDDGATLGRVLFYDEKLSALEDISCASCHLATQSFADNKDFSQGVNTLTSRNSMHLNDLGWTKNKGFFWDFRAENFHDAIELPLTDDNEIGADMEDITLKLGLTSYYADLFEKAYGDNEITGDRILDALSQFISSMNTFNSKFDKGAENEFVNFNQSEKDGLQLFSQACASCHTEGSGLPFFFGEGIEMGLEEQINFFPGIFTNSLKDVTDVGIGGWLDGMEHLFKSPTLRNVELTGPYMHDGRLETLDDVINFYSEETDTENEWDMGFIPPDGFQFTDKEKVDLKAFLLTLTDKTLGQNPKWSNPFKSGVATTDVLDIDVRVMPNPMHLYSDIKVDNPLGERINVNITNVTGKTIKSDYFTSENYRIEKAGFNSGLYYICLTKGNKLATYKLLVN